MTIYKLPLLVSVCLISINSISQNTDSTVFTLTEAKTYALDHHANIKNSLLDIKIAREQVIETRAMGLPQVSINGSFNHFINLPIQVVDASFLNPNAPEGETISFRAGTEYTTTGSLKVSQLIFNGSYFIGLKASNFYADFQKTAAKLTEEEVLFNVIQAYELAAIAKQNLIFADSIVSITERLIQKQQNYFDLGFMEQEDMDQLNYSLLTAKSAHTSAQVQFDNSMALLKLSMGFPIQDELQLKDQLESLIEASHVSGQSGDIFSNINYQLLEQKIYLTDLTIKNTKMANLPTLSAFFDQTYNAFRNDFNFFNDMPWYPQTVWGLQLNIPIFSGGERYSKTAQAKINLLKDQNSLVYLEESLKFKEIQIKNNLRGARQKFEMQKENVRLAASIYDNAVVKEKIGKGNSIVVTQKQQQLMMAQTEYVASLIELFQAKLELDKLYNNLVSTEQ